MSSKPTTLTSPGTSRRRSRRARIAPMAIASLIARIAVGRRPSSQARSRTAMPPSMLAGPTMTRSSRDLDAEPARSLRGSRAGVGSVTPSGSGPPGAGGSTPRTEDVAMAQAGDVLGGRARAADVVDLDAAVLGQRGRVDEHDRQAGAADLLDLGVRVGQADGDDAVDRRPAHRPGQAAVERRDEVQAVAVLLGDERDALAEGPEERVAEDDAERLRGEHADGHRLALGQHPRDRMGRVAELLGDLADPDRRSPGPADPGC